MHAIDHRKHIPSDTFRLRRFTLSSPIRSVFVDTARFREFARFRESTPPSWAIAKEYGLRHTTHTTLPNVLHSVHRSIQPAILMRHASVAQW